MKIQRGDTLMTKKLRVRVIGTLLVSALLFVLPIGAILSNNSMVTTVHAEDSDSEEPDNGTEIIVERLDESGSGENTESTENTGTEGEQGGGTEGEGAEETPEPTPTPTPEPLACTCNSHCTSRYNYDSNCEACSADFTKCEYINPNVTITITAPEGWSKDKAKIAIGVKDALNTGNFEIVKTEAKIGQNGSWQDITEEMFIEVTENCSVYVQVTDQNNKVYSKNKSINCFDKTNPTLNAAVSNGLLTVVGYDSQSGIKAFYVNGYEFKEFTNNTLNVRLQQFDTGYEYFTVQAMDNSGNMSEVYKTKNPYYDDDKSDDDDKGASTLPVNATASAPSSATATVTDHTKTDSQGNTTYSSKQEQEKHQAMKEADEAEAAEKEGEEKEETSETGKEFYTIKTQSEKVFYLVIDRDGDDENVYFLTEIDENDLMNTVSTTSETLPKNSAALESAIPTEEEALSNNNVESGVTVTDAVEEKEEEPEPEVIEEPEVEEPKPQSNLFTYILIGVISVGAIAAWYYLKMVKGKKEAFLDEDDEEDDEDEYYESDEETEEGGGEDDFFRMDDEPIKSEVSMEDAAEDVADTIDE